jgi:hypothetical protein
MLHLDSSCVGSITVSSSAGAKKIRLPRHLIKTGSLVYPSDYPLLFSPSPIELEQWALPLLVELPHCWGNAWPRTMPWTFGLRVRKKPRYCLHRMNQDATSAEW